MEMVGTRWIGRLATFYTAVDQQVRQPDARDQQRNRISAHHDGRTVYTNTCNGGTTIGELRMRGTTKRPGL